jgi:hypothetical protein
LIAVFNEGFAKLLSSGEQQLHLLALAMTAVATVVIMTQAALHRLTEPDSVSDRLVAISSRLLTVGMIPLVLAIPRFLLDCSHHSKGDGTRNSSFGRALRPHDIPLVYLGCRNQEICDC